MSEALNPFEPPKTEWDRPVERAEEGVDYFVNATRSTRFANNAIDSLAMIALTVVMGDDWYFLVLLGYYLFFETLFGKTPGKWITKTRVITKYGRRPRFLQILGRTLTRFVPFEALTFLGPKGKGWHDTWSGTRVVLDPGTRQRRRRRRRR